jgi:hypothetical protein
MVRILFVLFFVFCCAGGAQAGDGVLENELLRLEISPENGSIVRILDKRTATEYIGDPSQAKLFRLLLPRPDYLSRRINSWEQQLESLEVEDGRMKLRYRDLQISRQRYLFQIGAVEVPEPQLPIGVTVTLVLAGDHILATLEVDNASREEITDVTFPWLGGLTRVHRETPGRVVLPALADRILTETADFALGERGKRYPTLLATTWLNYEFEGIGIGIEARSSAETQDALVSLSPNTMAGGGSDYLGPPNFPYIGWNFYPHIQGMSRWRSPEVVIHVHDSDWHTLAGEHREWYRQNFAPPQRTAFDEAIGFATFRLKREDNTIHWRYDEIPQLAETAAAAGIRHLVLLGWREREGPGNPTPFGETADPRLGGAERLRAVIEQLEAEGVSLVFAFHPAVLSTASEPYQAVAQQWTVKTRRQANQMHAAYTFFSVDYPYEDYGNHYWALVDPASPASGYLLQQANRLREEYGFRHLFLRGVGLHSFLSYNRRHAVPPQQVFQTGYERFLGGLRELFPGGLLLTEGFSDLVNRYGSAGYTWGQAQHAEVLAYSLPWTPFSHDVEALDYAGANAAFARKILINAIVDGGDGTLARYPEFTRHLRALQRLKQATASYYSAAEFRDRGGLRQVQADPDVVVSVFQNPSNGRIGIVFANLSREKRDVSATVDLPGFPVRARFFRLNGDQEDVRLARGELSVSLAPREVLLVGIDP